MSELPDAAIEAGREAVAAMYRDQTGSEFMLYADIARAAIEAAMPAIREHIAQEIEAQMADVLDQDGDAVTAIYIVRGGTP